LIQRNQEKDMRRIALRLIIAVLTFSVGIVAGQITLLWRQSAPKMRTLPVPAPAPSNLDRKYETGVMGHGVTKDGYTFAVTGFASSDGMQFSRESVYYQSPQRAIHQLQVALRKATAVIRQEPFMDKNGRACGEKVIATFPAKSRFGKASVLWTDGSTFRYVCSSSLQNILQEERDLNDLLP
jgi:hypothetical protein